MAKGTTYSLTDMLGNKHTRYSARHIGQHYTHAVVRYRNATDVPGKTDVSYHSNKFLAEREQHRSADMMSTHEAIVKDGFTHYVKRPKPAPAYYAVTVHELTATAGRQ